MNPIFKNIISVFAYFLLLNSCKNYDNDQIAIVKFSLEGDFGQEYSNFSLFKLDGKIKAKLETNGNENGSVLITIDSSTLKKFDGFLLGFKKIGSSGYCTSIINCKVKTEEETIDKTNIDCNWNGFEDLKEDIFGKDYREKYLKSTY